LEIEEDCECRAALRGWCLVFGVERFYMKRELIKTLLALNFTAQHVLYW
jgi:hypothetical protein